MSEEEDNKKTDAEVPDDAVDEKAAQRERLMSFYRQPSQVVVKEPELQRSGSGWLGDDPNDARVAALLESVQGRAPPQVAEFLKNAAPIIVPAFRIFIMIFNIVGPLYWKLFKFIYWFLSMLPWDLFEATMGIGLCFFGGGYCASIAACEAFAMTGWPVTKGHLQAVYEAAIAMDAAQKADDEKDDDGDGVKDVDALTASEFVDRKFRVAANAVQDPNHLVSAVGGLYTSWLSVQATLRIKFARTITLAISIASFVEYYVVKAFLPILTPFVAVEFVHWLPTVLNSFTRGVFIWFAWKLQEVVSAVQSALRGGMMFSRGILNFINKRGFKHIGPFSLEHEHTYVDEALGYFVAVCGVCFQWSYGFGMPFPISLIMIPFDIVEWYIRYSITTGGATPGA